MKDACSRLDDCEVLPIDKQFHPQGSVKKIMGNHGKLTQQSNPPIESWHSVRCMHAVIGKFTNIHFGILNKSEILGLKGLKVCP